MIENTLELAQKTLLDPTELSFNQLEKQLFRTNTIDYSELYFENSFFESWLLEDRIVKMGCFNLDSGIGVRAISGDKTGFSYSDDITLSAIEQAAQAARCIAPVGHNIQTTPMQTLTYPKLYDPLDPLTSLSKIEKMTLLRLLDEEARRLDPRIQEVSVRLSGSQETVLVMASDGTLAADIRPLVRIDVNVVAVEGNRRESGFSGGGGRYDYGFFSKAQFADQALHYAQEAVRVALVNLESNPTPAGLMPVVLGSGWAGVLLHEAIGHGLEGDFNRKGSSAFSGRIGERVAASGCTVVDDGTLFGRRGSLNIDDEGTQSQCNILIEDGILKSYMQDKLNAKLMGVSPTGNARRESYAHLPMPRMTNTYMLAGQYDPQEIIASVEDGLYAVNFGGGQVDITSGKFVFTVSEAYRIEKGKITHPVKGATLIGDGPDILTKVRLVGHDLQLDGGIGICGKDGQNVPVGVGQPTLLVDEMTVGGTSL